MIHRRSSTFSAAPARGTPAQLPQPRSPVENIPEVVLIAGGDDKV